MGDIRRQRESCTCALNRDSLQTSVQLTGGNAGGTSGRRNPPLSGKDVTVYAESRMVPRALFVYIHPTSRAPFP